MSTAAVITINGTPGSNGDLPINTLVNLANQGAGGENTWLWELVDAPTGSSAALSSTTAATTSFTPDCEGTYLVSLIVNQGQGGANPEASDAQAGAVLQILSGTRIPAAQETTEFGGNTGWKPAVNQLLGLVDGLTGDAGIVAAVAGGSIAIGAAVKLAGSSVLKSGLPGQITVPTATAIDDATDSLGSTQPVGVLVGIVPFSPRGPATSGNVLQVRVRGLWVNPNAYSLDTWTVGYPIWLGPTGSLQPSPGAYPRCIGRVLATSVVSGSQYITCWIEGSAALEKTIDLSIADALVASSTQVVAMATRSMVIPSDCAGSLARCLSSPGTGNVVAVGIFQNGAQVATVSVSHPSGFNIIAFSTVGDDPILINAGDWIALVPPAQTYGLSGLFVSLLGA